MATILTPTSRSFRRWAAARAGLDEQSGERGSHLAAGTNRGVAHDLLASDGEFAASAVAITVIGTGSRHVLFRIDIGHEFGGQRLNLSFVGGVWSGLQRCGAGLLSPSIRSVPVGPLSVKVQGLM